MKNIYELTFFFFIIKNLLMIEMDDLTIQTFLYIF